MLEEEILNLPQALEALSYGETIGLLEGNKSFFKLQEKKIIIITNNLTAKIDVDDFIKLYHDYKFYIYDNKESEIVDEGKDKEYYSWNHK